MDVIKPWRRAGLLDVANFEDIAAKPRPFDSVNKAKLTAVPADVGRVDVTFPSGKQLNLPNRMTRDLLDVLEGVDGIDLTGAVVDGALFDPHSAVSPVAPPETYRVGKGDNPSSIARRLFPEAAASEIPTIAMQIMEANGIRRPERLQIGQMLLTPSRSLEVGDEARRDYAADEARLAALETARRQARTTQEAPVRPFPVVIGGAFDGYMPEWLGGSENAKDYASRYPEAMNFTHIRVMMDKEGVAREIAEKAAALGRPAALLGHSLGADEAYDLSFVLEKSGVPLAGVVTADPVGRGRREGSPNAPWINVSADPVHPWQISNVVAELGGKPSGLPVADADYSLTIPVDHWNLGGMLSRRGASSASSRSAEEILGLTPRPLGR